MGSTRSPRAWATCGLDARVHVGECADRTGNRACGHLFACCPESPPVPFHFRVGLRHFQTEGRRFRVHSVRSTRANGVAVLERPPPECGKQPVESGIQNSARTAQLHREARVEHIRRRQAEVDEARVGTDYLGEMGKECDHVVTRLPLDFVDAVEIEFRVPRLPDRRGGRLRNSADFRQRVAGMGLDFEPDAVTRLRSPDFRHLRARIARNHLAARAVRFPRNLEIERNVAVRGQAAGDRQCVVPRKPILLTQPYRIPDCFLIRGETAAERLVCFNSPRGLGKPPLQPRPAGASRRGSVWDSSQDSCAPSKAKTEFRWNLPPGLASARSP